MSKRNTIKILYYKMENYIKYKRIWKSGEIMTRKGKEFRELTQIGVAFIFTIYGFLALTNPDSFPLLHIKLDPLIGFILFLVGVYIIFIRR